MSLAGNRAGPAGTGPFPVCNSICATARRTNIETLTGAEGIFRLRDVELGIYEAHAGQAGIQDAWSLHDLELTKRELSTFEFQMQALTALAPENKGPSGLPGTPRARRLRPLQLRLIRA